ncbi:MAG: hypothetical protein V7631_3635 [Massilia sp.]|jgi:hypothetical protein
MNSPNLQPNKLSADALYDELEHELLALTTASLDDEDAMPPPVDEFATEFLLELGRAPCPPRPPC